MRHLVVAPGCVYSPGKLIVAAGRVVSAGPCRGRVAELAIAPGLVNAHAHLQLPSLTKAVREFLPWIGAVMARRAALSDPQLVATTARGIRSLLTSGCTAVGEIDSTGLSPSILRAAGLAGRCYRELVGFDLDAAGSKRLMRELTAPATRRAPRGWSPHAPYSVSPALFRAARNSGLPLAVHTAEIPEEVEFLATGRGPFRDLLNRLGRLPPSFRAPGLRPVPWLDRLGLLGPSTALVHCQEVASQDFGRLVATRTPLIVCPGTIRYFRRSPPDVPAWQAMGLSVGLGTDSRSSNQSFSMCKEMATGRRLWPALSPTQILWMATLGGANALSRPGLGTLHPGRNADFISVETQEGEDTSEWLDAFTHGERRILETRLRGRSVEHKDHSA